MVAELARIHHLRGNIFFPLGNIEGCREEHERGLGFAQRSGSPEAEARALGGLADAAYAQGRMRSAFDHFSRCVALSQQHGFGRIEVANRSMVGSVGFISMRCRKQKKTATPLLAPPRLSDSPAPNCWGKPWVCSPAMSMAHSI
jgi:hypothetical protein